MAAFGLVMTEEPDPPGGAAQAAAPVVCEVWPEHVDALNLLLACLGQLQQNLGGLGGARWRGAQAVNVAQEARWLGLTGQRQAPVVQQYRAMEAEALRILNEREAGATRKR